MITIKYWYKFGYAYSESTYKNHLQPPSGENVMKSFQVNKKPAYIINDAW